jgi:Asp/Glu/Hydantoin racemase
MPFISPPPHHLHVMPNLALKRTRNGRPLRFSLGLGNRPFSHMDADTQSGVYAGLAAIEVPEEPVDFGDGVTLSRTFARFTTSFNFINTGDTSVTDWKANSERDEMGRLIMDELVLGVFQPATVEYFQEVIRGLHSGGCDAVVLGCTEIPLIIIDANSSLPTLDSTRLLARAASRKSVDAAQ